MKLKIKTSLDSKEVAAPSPKLQPMDSYPILHCRPTRAVTTIWGTTAIARWLVATVTLILRGIFLSRQVTVPLPAFSALRVAAWAIRLATSLNSAWLIGSQSPPGWSWCSTDLMLSSVNFYRLRSSQLSEMLNTPSEPNLTLLPLSSCSTKAVAHIRQDGFTIPRLCQHCEKRKA